MRREDRKRERDGGIVCGRQPGESKMGKRVTHENLNTVDIFGLAKLGEGMAPEGAVSSGQLQWVSWRRGAGVVWSLEFTVDWWWAHSGL